MLHVMLDVMLVLIFIGAEGQLLFNLRNGI